jgi:hypothetical protein
MSWWEWVPIVKTIGHALEDPAGRATTDYAPCSVTVASCEGLGKVVAELQCNQCISKMRNDFILDWLGVGTTGPELLEGVGAVAAFLTAKYGAAAVAKAATGVGAVLLIDDAIDVSIIIEKALEIGRAAEAARKSLCVCGP